MATYRQRSKQKKAIKQAMREPLEIQMIYFYHMRGLWRISRKNLNKLGREYREKGYVGPMTPLDLDAIDLREAGAIEVDFPLPTLDELLAEYKYE